MAAFFLQSLHAGDSQPEQTWEHSLFNGENPAAPNIHLPRLSQPAKASDPDLEGYTLYKADPIPGSRATWKKAERTPMFANDDELRRMVRERAIILSAARQYKGLRKVRRNHVNRLICDRKLDVPDALWTCVFAKEQKCSSSMRNGKIHNPKTVALDIILMRRPLSGGFYPTSPMGDIVDLRVSRLRQPSGLEMDTDADILGPQSSSDRGGMLK